MANPPSRDSENTNGVDTDVPPVVYDMVGKMTSTEQSLFWYQYLWSVNTALYLPMRAVA